MRIKITIQYKGTNYCGWQVQPNGVTVQELIQKALARIFQKKINVIGSGRTDSGVHALGQVAHFDVEGEINFPKFIHSLNSLLPDDIGIISAKKVPGTFHAQLTAKKKTYVYTLLNSRMRSVFLNDTVWQVIPSLDIKAMKKAAKYLIGIHDFKSFCAADSTAKTTVRKIYKITITKIPPRPPLKKGGWGDLIQISITGNGFLKQMVRSIVGTLVEVGRGKRSVSDFQKILKACDRKKAGKTAPAKGLMLKEVIY